MSEYNNDDDDRESVSDGAIMFGWGLVIFFVILAIIVGN